MNRREFVMSAATALAAPLPLLAGASAIVSTVAPAATLPAAIDREQIDYDSVRLPCRTYKRVAEFWNDEFPDVEVIKRELAEAAEDVREIDAMIAAGTAECTAVRSRLSAVDWLENRTAWLAEAEKMEQTDPERYRFLNSLRIKAGKTPRTSLGEWRTEERCQFVVVDWWLRRHLPLVLKHMATDVEGAAYARKGMHDWPEIEDYEDLIRFIPGFTAIEEEIDGHLTARPTTSAAAWSLIHQSGLASVSALVEEDMADNSLEAFFGIVRDLAERLAVRMLADGGDWRAMLTECRQSVVELLARIRETCEEVVINIVVDEEAEGMCPVCLEVPTDGGRLCGECAA